MTPQAADAPPPRQPRRSNAERSRETRERILGAALECLVQEGYAATTTAAVQQRARVSRGALLHHYPSRASLLVDAVRHLAEQQGDALAQRATAGPASTGSDPTWLDLLWESFESPLFGAVLELWVAARSDDDLHSALLPYERQIRRRLRGLARAGLVGDPTPEQDLVLAMTLTYYRGLALTSVLDDDPAKRAALLEGWRRAARLLLEPDRTRPS